jgi:localization factor PodJL
MNITAREQAQAFDQLGLNVMALNERLERLERSAAHDGIKDAVKALHQGLSRLADQITATANNSASQVVQLTSNLEQLAGRVGQMRVDSETADKALDARIDASERAVDARIEAAERSVEARLSALDGRLGSAEKSAQFNTNALDHALEKIEGSANQRATDQVENQKRSAQHEESLNRLEDSIARLEMRLPDAEFERRLDGIERSISGMSDRLEQYDPTAKFDTSMQAMSYRIEALEKDHADLLGELRAKVLRPVEPPPYEAPPRERPAPQASYPSAFEAPPLAEPPAYEALAHEPPPFSPYGSEPVDAFTPPTTPHGFAFDIPSEADPFAPPPEFADVFADTPQQENFLAQARRSARAASEKSESERRGRFAGLRWNKETAQAADGEEKTKPRYLVPLLLALIVAALAAAALVLNQRAKEPQQPVTKPAAPSVTAAPPASTAPFTVAPQAGAPSNKLVKPAPQSAHTMARTPAQQVQNVPPRTTAPLAQHEVHPAPIKPVPEPAKPASAAPSQDRVIQLANTGNPIALTILGLRALDGTPVNLPDAVKFLTQAAEKGQAVAQYRLGTLYERGQGVPADPAKAAHWYEMAANQGNRKAMHNLAVSDASGAAGKKNMPDAARWFAKAAALGLADSQFNLAVLYERGDGVPQSLLDAYKWYSIAAASGDSESKARMTALQSQLSDADKAAANKSAATFHPAPLSRAANVPPEPADLGG